MPNPLFVLTVSPSLTATPGVQNRTNIILDYNIYPTGTGFVHNPYTADNHHKFQIPLRSLYYIYLRYLAIIIPFLLLLRNGIQLRFVHCFS